MATIRQVIEGLEILERVFGPDAEIDGNGGVIYAGPHVSGIIRKGTQTMNELGWFVSTETGRWCLPL